MTQKNPYMPAPGALRILRILALIGLLISSYLAWKALHSDTSLAGCGGENSGCSEVTGTRWSKSLGIPVSLGGAVVYAGLLVVLQLLSQKAARWHWLALIALSMAAATSALWFTGLQAFEVKSYCYYCLAVHLCSLSFAMVLFANIPGREQDPERANNSRRSLLVTNQIILAGVAGLLATAVMAAGQMQRFNKLPEISTGTVSPAPAMPQPQPQTFKKRTVSNRPVSLNNGKLKLNLGDYPVIGPTSSEHFVAHLFDFTCPACRALHPMLQQQIRKPGNNTALIMIPMPLDSVCNPAIQETSYEHRDACLFAKIGLAIWDAKPEAYSQYDAFVFQGEYPPPLSMARDLADQLAGKDAIDAALADPEITERLRQGIQLFYSPMLEKKALPVLVTEHDLYVGIPQQVLLQQFFQ